MTEPSTSTTAPAGLAQPAIWPAADVVFDTPEAAAADFVTEVLGVPPSLGEFQQGDSRSGEIEVFSPGEGDAGTEVVRGLLFATPLGPDDGWFILAAVNDNASITAPEPMDEVVAGPLVVEGRARGFEGNVVVTAFVAGDADPQLDQVMTQAGAFETPEPFTVTLDLSGRTPGDTVVLLVPRRRRARDRPRRVRCHPRRHRGLNRSAWTEIQVEDGAAFRCRRVDVMVHTAGHVHIGAGPDLIAEDHGVALEHPDVMVVQPVRVRAERGAPTTRTGPQPSKTRHATQHDVTRPRWSQAVRRRSRRSRRRSGQREVSRSQSHSRCSTMRRIGCRRQGRSSLSRYWPGAGIAAPRDH